MSLKLPSIFDNQYLSHQELQDHRQSRLFPTILNLDRKQGATSLENSPVRRRTINPLLVGPYDKSFAPQTHLNSHSIDPNNFPTKMSTRNLSQGKFGSQFSPDASPMRNASNTKSMVFPAGMLQSLSNPNYNQRPAVQNPKFLAFPGANSGHDNNNVLLQLVEKQNNLIEKMSHQVNSQARQMMNKETKVLKEKLRRLEYERMVDQKVNQNALSNQYNMEQLQKLNQIDAERFKPNPQEKPKKKKNKGIVDLLKEYKVLDKVVRNKKFEMLQKQEAMLKKVKKRKSKILPTEFDHPPESEEYQPEYQPLPPSNTYKQPKMEYKPRIYRSPSIQPITPPPQHFPTEDTFEEDKTISDQSQTVHHIDFGDIDESVESPGKPVLRGMDETRNSQPHASYGHNEDNVYENENENEGRVGKIKTKYKKPTGRPSLRALLWTIVLPDLLADNIKELVEEHRTDIQEVMTENIKNTFDVAQEFLIRVGDKHLKSLISCRNNLEMDDPKELSAKDIDSKVNLIVNNFKFLFESMLTGTNKQNLASDFLRFLAFISEDSGMLPHNFMFEFEINRLQFTSYATLKNMTDLSSKMILGCFILLRVLLYKIIMRPWTVFSSLKENNINKKNLLTIGSILYHTIIDYFRENISICPNNQKLLPDKLKVKPQTVRLNATDQAIDAKSKSSKPVTDVIPGFLTKKQLKVFFVDRKPIYENLKKNVADWLEKIYQLTHNLYLNTPKEERILLGLPTHLLQ